MSIKQVVTQGYGSYGNIESIVMLGYGADEEEINDNDLQTIEEIGSVSPNMGPQRFGGSYVKDGENTVAQYIGQQKISNRNGPNANLDPNNNADRLNDRFDDRTYYRRNRS